MEHTDQSPAVITPSQSTPARVVEEVKEAFTEFENYVALAWIPGWILVAQATDWLSELGTWVKGTVVLVLSTLGVTTELGSDRVGAIVYLFVAFALVQVAGLPFAALAATVKGMACGLFPTAKNR